MNALGAKYQPHTFDFTIDVGSMVKQLSPLGQIFFIRVNEDKGEYFTVSQLYTTRWQDDSYLLNEFNKLSLEDQLEVLCIYTIPIHEFRHHFDMILTPFAAYFYISLIQEYIKFQEFSPFLLQNQNYINPGPLRELDIRLDQLGNTIPQDWDKQWFAFKKQLLKFEACDDVRGINPISNSAIRHPDKIVKIITLEFEEVTINKLAASFAPKDKPNWYMRAATLLEGRAVIESLLWIIWNLNNYSELPNILRNYIKTLYSSNGNYDYRCLLDIAAAFIDSKSIEEAITKYENNIYTVQYVLHIVDVAAWFALNIATKIKKGKSFHENLFVRFIYALNKMYDEYCNASTDAPLDLLGKIEQLQAAKNLNLLNLSEGLQNSLTFVRQQRTSLYKIWNTEIRTHFDFILEQLEKSLILRLQQGYISPLAAPFDYNLLAYIDDDHQFLLQEYEAKKWVKEWFRFRNQSIFTPDTSRNKRKHLAAQFGFAALQISCHCGILISAAVPKWRNHHRIRCRKCKTIHNYDSEDLIYIHLPEELE